MLDGRNIKAAIRVYAVNKINRIQNIEGTRNAGPLNVSVTNAAKVKMVKATILYLRDLNVEIAVFSNAKTNSQPPFLKARRGSFQHKAING
jgi:hypothetical protein